MNLTHLVALAAALGWASGLRLYAVVFMTGAAGWLGWVPLPDGLSLLQHPVVLGAPRIDRLEGVAEETVLAGGQAVAVALEELPSAYYTELSATYRRRRDLLCGALTEAGFRCVPPEGAYYVLADFSPLSDQDDTAFAHWLTATVGVAPVPGSSFFRDPLLGKNLVRFAFCKTDEMLVEAAGRLRGMGGSS